MRYKRSDKAKYFKLGAFVGVACVLLACLGSYAWYHANREIYTFTHVQKPSTLAIKGGNETTIEQIELSDVNMTETTGKKQFVFCVVGQSVEYYDMELAFTTNVQFDYSIYKATETPSSELTGATYAEYTENGISYYYKYNPDSPLAGTYINRETAEDSSMVADVAVGSERNKHAEAYGTYGTAYVQKHAEPVYYLFAKNKASAPAEGETQFVDYYVLELSWDNNVSYNKETDLIYLLAENSAT